MHPWSIRRLSNQGRSIDMLCLASVFAHPRVGPGAVVNQVLVYALAVSTC